MFDSLSLWHGYLVLGLALCAAEMLLPVVVLLPIGLGALATAAVAAVLPAWATLFAWGLFSLAFFKALRALSRRSPAPATGVDGMVGRRARLTRASGPDGGGELKLYGDVWGVAPGAEALPEGAWVEIVEVVGNRVRVAPAPGPETESETTG